MEMTDEEILRNYNSAQHKRVQIGIIADLNGCTTKEIEDIIVKNGGELPQKGGRKPKEKLSEKLNSEESQNSLKNSLGVPQSVLDLIGVRLEAISLEDEELLSKLTEIRKRREQLAKERAELTSFYENNSFN